MLLIFIVCIINLQDVFLLAESLLFSRQTLYKSFKLDMLQYVSVSQLSFDAYLLMTKVELEVMSDIDMILEVEENLRGGFSFVRERYMESSENEQLALLDANGLYGFCQTMPLPEGEYSYLTREEIDAIDWTAQEISQPYGYAICCDLT